MKKKFTDPKHGTKHKPSKPREDYIINEEIMKDFNTKSKQENTNFYHG